MREEWHLAGLGIHTYILSERHLYTLAHTSFKDLTNFKHTISSYNDTKILYIFYVFFISFIYNL